MRGLLVFLSFAGCLEVSVVSPPDVVEPPFQACEESPPVPSTCNGDAVLCGREYNDVAYATSHNAFSIKDEDFLLYNQHLSLFEQMTMGVRGLMLDIYDTDDGVMLCHGGCEFGERPLIEGLREISEFLRCNPGEVVTIIFETYAEPENVRVVFDELGLLPHLHHQVHGDPWPTLGELIERDTRLIVFTDAGGGSFDGYLDVFTFAWEVPFHAEAISDFTCDLGRGSRPNDLFIFNHFLTKIAGDKVLAGTVNFNPFLIDRAQECQAVGGQIPNFVTLDFVDIGDIIEATKLLNGL